MDILFFAALAFYIFLKLGKNLGKIDEDEKKQIQEKIIQKQQEIEKIQQQIKKQTADIPVIKAHSTADRADYINSNLDEKSTALLKTILEKSKMEVGFFINGAKSAFEMIIKAFSSGDLVTLKFLLSEKIYQGFEAAIKQRQEQGRTLNTNLIAVNNPEIISVAMLDNLASIVVKIVSKQINYITNKDGDVVEGRKDEISEIVDVWTFTKDVTIPDPKWVVSVTAK